jgi:hypothetical protein
VQYVLICECTLPRYAMSLMDGSAWLPVMDIGSPIHRAHCDCGQPVCIAQRRTDRQAPADLLLAQDGAELP